MAYPDDLVFTHRGTIGQVGIIPNLQYPYYLVSQSQMRLTVNKEYLNPRYLYYWFLSSTGQHELLKNSAQVGVPSIASPTKSLKEIDIRLPNVKTQSTIAEILSSLDDKIELNNQINKNLEALAQALFKQWFVDFEFPNENGQPYKSSGGEMVKSELGEIPKGWRVSKLKELLTIKRGGSPRPIQDFMSSSGLPWVKISDATAVDSPFLFRTKEFIKKEGLTKTVLLRKGSLILSNSATPGLPKFLELDACIHDGWLHFQDNKGPSYNFLYFFFLSIRENLVGRGNGSIFINLKTDILKEYALTVPSDNILNLFDEISESILQQVKQSAFEIIELQNLRDFLLPQLISGELEVQNV